MSCSLVNGKPVAPIPEDNAAGSSETSVCIHTPHQVTDKKTSAFSVVNVINETTHKNKFDVLTVVLMKTQPFLHYSDSGDEDSMLL
jgi:hypothetical protein